MKENKCKICGCTDSCACPGGCYWVNDEKTICSACVKKLPKGALGKVKCYQTVYFDFNNGFVDYDNPKNLYEDYIFGEDYTVIAKRGQTLYITFDNEKEKYITSSKNKKHQINFETIEEINDFWGFEAVEIFNEIKEEN